MSGALIVTGASRGIGAAIARRAAAEGWQVAVNYNASAARAEEVADDIRAAGGAAIAVRADVACEDDLARLFDETEAAFGAIRGLVNNAGILPPPARFEEISSSRWARTFEVNAAASFLAARMAVQRMTRHRLGGAIVNISSMAAPRGAAFEFVDYAASKGAVESMTLGLAAECARDGIRVNAVRPGLIDTEIQLRPDGTNRAHDMAASVPMGRMGTALEVAEATVWLLSQKASYVTGAILPVSGGR